MRLTLAGLVNQSFSYDTYPAAFANHSDTSEKQYDTEYL